MVRLSRPGTADALQNTASRASLRGRRALSWRWLPKACSRPIIFQWLRFPYIGKGDSPDERIEPHLGWNRLRRRHSYIYGRKKDVFLTRPAWSSGHKLSFKLIVAGRCSRA
ncbi:hypothetical protein DPMN_167110 [Dreissena polymorpha]|uniref:Uncharacterized protein n=1 Tax=Dreissena polymorpha TaxID=45954 RepID=A0A9D4IY07_DREPO|nr:hypothetical protein DPMN_167110 [Dreissena polymorpha]